MVLRQDVRGHLGERRTQCILGAVTKEVDFYQIRGGSVLYSRECWTSGEHVRVLLTRQ